MKPKLRFQGFHDDWEEKKLGEVAEIVGGGTPSTEISEYWNGNIQWFTPTEIANKRKVKQSQRTITKLGVEKSSAKLLPRNTILLTTRASLGDMSILLNEACTNQGFQSLIANSKVSVNFLYYCQPKIKNYCYKFASGSTFLEISKKQLSKLLLHLPSLPEQEKIGAFLSQLDDRIEKQEQKIALLKERKKGWMQQLFSQNIRFKDENGQDYPKWEIHSVSDFGDIITGNTPSKSNIEFYDKNDGYVWVTPTDISDNRYISKSSSLLTERGLEKARRLPRNTLLVTCIASIGKNAILTCEGSCNQQINAIVPNNDYSVDFLYSLMEQNKQFLESNAGQTATKIINKTDFSTLRFLVPSLPEQEKIANFLSVQDELIGKEEEKLSLLKEQKKGLLQQMFI